MIGSRYTRANDHHCGVPSFAISQEARHEVPRGAQSGRFDFTDAGAVARQIAERILAEGLPSKDILLNVNVPQGGVKGARCARQGKRTYDEVVHVGTDPRGGKYYWIGSGVTPHEPQAPDTDYMVVHEGSVAVCPLHLDLTHYATLEHMRESWSDIDERVRAAVED